MRRLWRGDRQSIRDGQRLVGGQHCWRWGSMRLLSLARTVFSEAAHVCHADRSPSHGHPLRWTGAVFHCVTYDSANANEHTFDELVAEQTPGGLNEQVLREMREVAVMSSGGRGDGLTA